MLYHHSSCYRFGITTFLCMSHLRTQLDNFLWTIGRTFQVLVDIKGVGGENGKWQRRLYFGFGIVSVFLLIHLKCPQPSIYTKIVLKIVTLFNAYLYNALYTRTNPVSNNPLIRGGVDKSLAGPGRKQATATKLGNYSTYYPRSSYTS
jgi:hypothetical protein